MIPQSIYKFEEWFEVLHTTERSQVAMMELAPGQATGDEAEAHESSDQILLVIKGVVHGEIEGRQVSLSEGQFIVIHANTKHRFVNESEDGVLTFNVYAAPAYPPDTKG